MHPAKRTEPITDDLFSLKEGNNIIKSNTFTT